MALVAYSDSESDGEGPAPPPSKPKSSLSGLLPPPSKKRKLVDISAPVSGGPRKIVVDLPRATASNEDRDEDKRPKAANRPDGSGILGFLPAPKRTGAAAAAVIEEAKSEVTTQPAVRILGGAAAAKMEYAGTAPMAVTVQDEDEDVTEEAKTATSSAMIKPQSVARPGPVKGRTIQPFIRKSAAGKSKGVGAAPEAKKVSLFSLGASLNDTRNTTFTSTGEYQPIMIDSTPAVPKPAATLSTSEPEAVNEAPMEETRSLESLGQSVGLDEASMRMLMGRRAKNMPVNLVDFNVDEEYNANEAARAAGELEPQKNVVRSIAPGKHQLSSLLNAAQSNRDALEESFASGRRNKKEAGSKYGW